MATLASLMEKVRRRKDELFGGSGEALRKVLLTPIPKTISVDNLSLAGKIGLGALKTLGSVRNFLESEGLTKAPQTIKIQMPETISDYARNALLDVASLGGSTLQGGYKIASGLGSGITAKDIFRTTDKSKVLSGLGELGRGATAMVGLTRVPAVAAYSALSGALSAGGKLLEGGKPEEALGVGVKSAVGFTPKALSMATLSGITGPIVNKLPMKSGLGKLGVKSLANVAEGIAIDKSAGFETTPTSILIDALFPVASDIAGKAFKTQKEAVRTLDAKLKLALGKPLRNNKGQFTTLEKYIKKTRAYTKRNKNKEGPSSSSLGVLLGFDISQDEDGNWKVTFDEKRALLGLAGGAVVGRVTNKIPADDLGKAAKRAKKGLTAEGVEVKTDVVEEVPVLGKFPKPVAKAIDNAKNLVVNIGEDVLSAAKDIGNIAKGGRSIYRNLEDAFGGRYDIVRKDLLDKFDDAKGNFIETLKHYETELDNYIVKKLGIKPKSNESALVQLYGEGKIGLDEVKKRLPNKWQNIVKADKWFRKKYDELLNAVNKVRASIYPNDPSKIIPRRENYYRHFIELAEEFGRLKEILESPSYIRSSLAGRSEFTRPKSRFLPFAQRRLGDKTEYDAVGGFINYIRLASYAMNIDPQIAKFREFAKVLEDYSEKAPANKKLNNLIEFVHDFANDLAGKTNPVDRVAQKYLGRKFIKTLDFINNRVKANVILGNARTLVAQVFNIPQAVGEMGFTSFTKGAGSFLRSLIDDSYDPTKKSTFLKERFYRGLDKFEVGMLNQTKRFLAWLMSAMDEVATKTMWHGFYKDALNKGIKDPIRYADNMTREMVAGRGIGEVPLIHESKMMQLVIPFQLEVANTIDVFGRWMKRGELDKILKFALVGYLMNSAAKVATGSDISFNPLEAVVDAYNILKEEDDKAMGGVKALGRLSGEVVSNVPLGQTLASLYPEYGGNVLGLELPQRREFFGEGDPTRFGSGILVARGLTDPLYKFLPPFGGQQLKKTIGGLESYLKGYSETDTGRVRFPIAQTTPNLIRTTLFGPYSVPEAVKYGESGGKPLSEVQSEVFKSLPKSDMAGFFESIRSGREENKEEEKIKNALLGKTGGIKIKLLGTGGKEEDIGVGTPHYKDGKLIGIERGKKFYYLEDGKVQSVDIDFDIPSLSTLLTGNETLDANIKSWYRGLLTSKRNSVLKLYRLGVINKDEAEKLLTLFTTPKEKKIRVKVSKVRGLGVPRVGGAKSTVRVSSYLRGGGSRLGAGGYRNLSKLPQPLNLALATSRGRKVSVADIAKAFKSVKLDNKGRK